MNRSGIYMRNLFLVIALLTARSAYAESDPELAHSAKCISLFSRHEYQYRLPKDSLYSISLQESGRKHSQKSITMPWPWTVNVEGKGYHFDSKQEAVQFVKRELAQGKQSIDVGCMQVNLKHHPDAFRSVEEALDPKANINYGASFLKSKYEQLGSWHKAIAHYHSATPELGNSYKNSVIKIAKNIKKYKDALGDGAVSSTKEVALVAAPSQHNTPSHISSKARRYRSDMMVYVPTSHPKT